jgi:hypothetical protein
MNNQVCGRPLVFGDTAQIDWLRRQGFYKPIIEGIKKFKVSVCIGGEVTYIVTAPDQKAAKELAHENISLEDLCDIDTTTRELSNDDLSKVDIEWVE